jgi:hypothetical protein
VTEAINELAGLQKKLIDNRLKYFDILSRASMRRRRDASP